MSSFVIVAIVAVVVGIGLYAFFSVLEAKRWRDVCRKWIESSQQAGTGLEGLEEDLNALPGIDHVLAELAECVRKHREEVDESSRVILEGRALSRAAPSRASNLVRRCLPIGLFKEAEADEETLRDRLVELRTARQTSMRPINTALEFSLPDLRKRISDLPIQAGVIATGILSVVGLIWMCGYYGMLGVPFMPLIRDLEDAALIGITAGLVPIVGFAVMLLLGFIRIHQARNAARHPAASAATIITSLKTVRTLRRPLPWALGAISWLGLIYLIALVAAISAHTRPVFAVSLTDSDETQMMRVLGGIGKYVVLEDASPGQATARRVTMPQDRIECLTDDGTAHDACVHAKTPVPPKDPEAWVAFVKEVAQCHVAAHIGDEPLFTPALIEGSPYSIDWRHYRRRADHWPWKDECQLDLSSPDSAARLEACSANALAAEVRKWLTNTENGQEGKQSAPPSPRERSLNVIGWASGTSFPARNHEISRARALHVAKQLRERLPDDFGDCAIEAAGKNGEGCKVPIRAMGLGEMRGITWAGFEGDVSSRVVLVTLCDSDVHP